jgi:predicted phosphodiesterase
MRLAVFSDIHGNRVALEAVLADMEAVGGIDHVWCLGDLSAFGSRPAECIRRVREVREAFGKEKFQVIGGNTDRYLITGQRFPVPKAKDEDAFKRLARDWNARDAILNWNVAQLSWEDYEWLAKRLGRETALEVEDYGWVIGYHAIPGDDEAMLKPDTPEDEARDYLLDREGRLGIGGHIHVQMDRDLGSWRAINVGSVGSSIDAPGRAQWGLFTFENDEVMVDLRRVPYDVDAAIADLEAVDHPVPKWVIRTLRPEKKD